MYLQSISDREREETFPIRITLEKGTIPNHNEQIFGTGNGNIHSIKA